MKVYFDKSLITTLRNRIFEMYDQKKIDNPSKKQDKA